MSKKILVIGGSAAGPKSAAKARRMDQNAEITILQKGPYLSMASCGYPYYVGGVFDGKDKLINSPTGSPRDSHFFKTTKDIEAKVLTEAVDIDRENKIVKAKNLETGKMENYSYDKLILATGANPIFPKLPGYDLKGIHTLQSVDDADILRQIANLKKVKNAVIVGGGLIGIETTEALNLAGIKVHVIEMQSQILPFLDFEMAKLVENHIEEKGSFVKTGVAVKEFLGENGVLNAVLLSDGTKVDCELAVISIGVRPNSELAKKVGLKVGETGGILVNKFMQTSDPDIYAAGDCVEIINLIANNKVKMHWPMGDAANLQGRVVGQNVIVGNQAIYEGAVQTGICKIFDMEVGSTGMSEKIAISEGYSSVITAIHAAPDKPGFMGGKAVILKMVADKRTRKLLGVQAVGFGDVSKRIALAAIAIHTKLHIADLVNLDLPYAPPFSPAIENFITASHVLENKCLGRMDGISSIEVKKKLDNKENIFMLDVRTTNEYDDLHLNIGETLIPLCALRKQKDILPKDKDIEIIVYCKISLRGYEAYIYLKSLGYTNVKVMEGGIVAWPFTKTKRS